MIELLNGERIEEKEILKLMEEEQNETHIHHYCQGLQNMLIPTQNNIKSWIRENLTC